ncbi:hypothetical protein BN1723_015818, partial [Verticillium longisporum]
QRLERELLLQSYSQPVSEATSPRLGAEDAESIKAPSIRHHRQAHHAHQQQSTLSEEDQQTVGAASNVTSSLRRTHDLIAAELARSEFAHQTLTESSAALAQLDESYGSLEGMLASSKDLLGTLVKSQKSDTWYLQTAMYMLLSTGAWLVFRRFLYGPAWWLVWLPIRMLYSLVMGGGGAVIKFGSSSGSSTVVVDQATVEVQGLPDSDLPTIDVGTAKAESTVVVKGDAEGLVEKIGKMVEDMPKLQADDELEDGEEADEFHNAVQEPVEVPQQRDELGTDKWRCEHSLPKAHIGRRIRDFGYAMDVVREAAEAWDRLITGKTQPGGISTTNLTVAESQSRVTPDQLPPLPAHQELPAEKIDASIDKWFFISGAAS